MKRIMPRRSISKKAKAMGKPVIGSSSVCSVADRVIDRVNGLVYKSGDIDALALAMKFFLANPDKIREYGSRSRETAEKYQVGMGLSVLEGAFN